MTSLDVFIWGVCGSLAVEIVEFTKLYYRHNFSMPYRYKLWHFYVLRLMLASIGGGLAIAYAIDTPLLAANIGAATPLLIEALAKNMGELPAPPEVPERRKQDGDEQKPRLEGEG